MSGGGDSAPAQPSTTTTIQDIPAWEQGYVTNLLGQAQTIAAQPYQQFPGQQVAGFTPDQTNAFSNIEGQQAAINPLQSAATGQSAAGANTANNIYGAGNPLINASAAAASPQGIQAYMSPFTNDVVNGIQNEANLNWNQNIMPSVNNEFVGSGQYGSGRNAQVLGQAAGNFQTGLSSNISNALQSGYSTAGQQAQNEAGNLLNAGNSLGNLAATQGNEQLAAGTNLQNLAGAQNTTALTNNQALQAVGQQQQQLNQTNLNTAESNWQNQTSWPAQQTEYLNQIIRGLPAPSATTSSTQTTPAYSVSPLSGLGGAGVGALALTGSNGQNVGTATGLKAGGLIRGYADGGSVEEYDPSLDEMYGNSPDDVSNPLAYTGDSGASPTGASAADMDAAEMMDAMGGDTQQAAPQNPMSAASPQPVSRAENPLGTPTAPPSMNLTPGQMQQNELLALARGMLAPSLGGSTAAALSTGLDNMQEVEMKQREMMMNQANLNYQRQVDQQKIGQEQEKIDQGRYTPVKDFYGNVTGMVEGKTGKFTPVNTNPQTGAMSPVVPGEAPSADPQKAAAQILVEQGSVPTQVGNKFDIAGRNKQTDAYNNQALAAKNVIQQLDSLDAQTGKYTPGKGAGNVYGAEQWMGIDPTGGATARAEADKSATQLANAFMQANTASSRNGIGVLNFDAKGVPNPDMPDQARADLIAKQKAIANSQIQRAEISNLYPRMQTANVNTIMNTYEQKNPPLMPDGNANPNWIPYQDWIKAGRPDTTVATPNGNGGVGQRTNSVQQKTTSNTGKVTTQADLTVLAQKRGLPVQQVTQDAIAKGYTIQ